MASSLNDSVNDANLGIIAPRRLEDTAFTTSSAKYTTSITLVLVQQLCMINGLNGVMFDGDLA